MATATADTLERLGVGFGVLFVLIGVATLAGTPWSHSSGSAIVMLGQILGALGAVAIGAGLAWLTRK